MVNLKILIVFDGKRFRLFFARTHLLSDWSLHDRKAGKKVQVVTVKLLDSELHSTPAAKYAVWYAKIITYITFLDNGNLSYI
jgi:hypothetical protein